MHHTARLYATAGAVLLTASALPASAHPARTLDTTHLPPPPVPGAGVPGPPVTDGSPRLEGSVTAAALRAKTRDCSRVSKGLYRTDRGRTADVPVCGGKDAVFWKADLDVDCDGRVTARCNKKTDPAFHGNTAFRQSDGKPLNAEKLPYVVVPEPSGTWDHAASGIRGGGVAAVVHGDRVEYAVVGDTGPTGLVGEASYAAARSLGIDPDPARGGVPSGVTYILFKDSEVTPIESRTSAVRLGSELARRFLQED
ncbi:glycoside hydrolase family 75 protein [Streptomyces sp. NBC_01725]|uniref:glycoside hydrolase family 75 protein n=1 Tax=Streptomyces sp. NBC_01725 TaxID=2975923 RepID=UPI002E2B7821|nr:glycoside hydrolase family 75 protein [Streptomyces sp. NBC_01725]